MSVPVDQRAIMTPEQAKAMRVRNALLELLRAWEDANDLPRAVPTKLEAEALRGNGRPPRTGGGHVKK